MSREGGWRWEVLHDRSKREFFILLSKEDRAVLQYEIEECGEQRIYDMYHTEVPKQYRGRGIGEQLARSAFKHVASQAESGARMRLSCWFLQDVVLPKMPEFLHLVI